MVWLDFTDLLRGQIATLLIIDKLKPAMSNVMSHKIHKDFSTAPCAIQLISKSAHGRIIPIIYPHSSLSLSRHMYLYLTSYVSYDIYIYIFAFINASMYIICLCMPLSHHPKKKKYYTFIFCKTYDHHLPTSPVLEMGHMGIVEDWMMCFLHIGWGRILQILSQQLHTNCYTVLYIREKALNFTYDWCIL